MPFSVSVKTLTYENWKKFTRLRQTILNLQVILKQ